MYPGDVFGGVLLAQVEEWNPPVMMSTVLGRIDRSAGARADFEVGVVRITAVEYDGTRGGGRTCDLDCLIGLDLTRLFMCVAGGGWR